MDGMAVLVCEGEGAEKAVEGLGHLRMGGQRCRKGDGVVET